MASPIISQPLSAASTPVKQTKKTRIVRRRGPARDDDIEDDGIIERAPLSDTESEPTDEDTASEDDEEDEKKSASAAVEPKPSATSAAADAQTPPAAEATTADESTIVNTSGPPSKETSQLWSDSAMLDVAANEDLPVIDFAELSLVNEGSSADPALKAKSPSTSSKAKSPNTPSIPTAEPGPGDAPAAAAEDAKPKPAPAHVTARQAYLKKLNADPSAIPRVGQFWGHDDRLMEKELRGMSDWWRGRWMGRGRGGGRGGGFMGRGRGRGGHMAPPAEPPKDDEPIVSQKWGHDGYEELLKQGEKPARGGKRGGPPRGRGDKVAPRGRGRGGLNGVPTSNHPSAIQAQLQAQAAARIVSSGSAASSPALTATAGPSAPPTVAPLSKASKKASKIPANPRSKVNALLAQATKERETQKEKSVVAAAKNEVAAEKANGDVTKKEFTPPNVRVNLPKAAAGKGRQLPTSAPAAPAASGADDLSATLPMQSPSVVRPTGVNGIGGPPVVTDLQKRQQHQRRVSDKERVDAMERAILKDSFTKTASAPNSDAVPSPATSQPPVAVGAPLSLTAQPASHPAYSYVNLPPGIAMGDSGMLYEIATGRPVMLNQQPQPTPPLPPPPAVPMGVPPMVPMYNPRPILHPQAANGGRPGSMPFIPQHVLNSSSQSMTPEYPPTPPNYGGYGGSPPVDASRGTPNFFAPPKPSRGVQIRAPAVKNPESEVGGQPKPLVHHQERRISNAAPPAPASSSYGNNALQFGTLNQQPTTTPQYNPQTQYYNGGYYGGQGTSTLAPYQSQPGAAAPLEQDPYYNPYYSQNYGYPAPPGMDYGYGAPVGDGSSYASAYDPSQVYQTMPPQQQQQQQQSQQHLYY